MLAMIAYVIAAASALAAAAFGLVILIGGSAQLGREAAVAADKALHVPGMQRSNDLGAAAKTPPDKTPPDKTTGVAASAATDAKPAQPTATQKQKSAKAAASKRKKKSARSTRNARRN